MKHLSQFILLLPLLLGAASARAQVGVGTATPDAKSALDIRATDKGLLIPRLTAAQRTGITSPPQGLMVYQTDGTAGGGAQTGFWYYAGTGGWVYLDAASGTLTLPYSGTASTSGSAFQITNSGGGIGVRGASASGQGVVGRVNGTGPGQGVVGVKGTTVPNVDDAGVVGLSEADYGVYAYSFQNIGVAGTTDGSATGVAGVSGRATGAGIGVSGTSSSGSGVEAFSNSGYGVKATSGSTAAVYGSASNNASNNGAVVGTNTNAGNAAVGVLGLTQNGWGVRGVASGSNGYGVEGMGTAGYGVRGLSNTGSGVYGQTDAASSASVAGVLGRSTSTTGTGVLGTTTSGYGVRGEASGTTGRAGYFAQTNAASTAPVVEIAQSGSGPALSVTGGAIRTAEVNAPATGSANLLPLAYGVIASDGTILNGSGNFTIAPRTAGSGQYLIEITTPANLNLDNAICQGTGNYGNSSNPVIVQARGYSGGLVEVSTARVNLFVGGSSGGYFYTDYSFSFVIYRP
ncbi:hypothetical protein JAO73_20900 [Hymenobacter sp. BT523]|uniref:hypothetical protein n=1 Tax=Hymenobacter sp. BT523 TaxID=2795725 RepID=UPI0018EB3B37|nr:hypothetical protein [Hymenobacter sp. BT523]MBJ6111493.1 hypothetical protein [Hymenobacter sp. BT523]